MGISIVNSWMVYNKGKSDLEDDKWGTPILGNLQLVKTKHNLSVDVSSTNPIVTSTIWLFNIAMENHQFE